MVSPVQVKFPPLVLQVYPSQCYHTSIPFRNQWNYPSRRQCPRRHLLNVSWHASAESYTFHRCSALASSSHSFSRLTSVLRSVSIFPGHPTVRHRTRPLFTIHSWLWYTRRFLRELYPRCRAASFSWWSPIFRYVVPGSTFRSLLRRQILPPASLQIPWWEIGIYQISISVEWGPVSRSCSMPLCRQILCNQLRMVLSDIKCCLCFSSIRFSLGDRYGVHQILMTCTPTNVLIP